MAMILLASVPGLQPSLMTHHIKPKSPCCCVLMHDLIATFSAFEHAQVMASSMSCTPHAPPCPALPRPTLAPPQIVMGLQ